jgi:hypothetical protein
VGLCARAWGPRENGAVYARVAGCQTRCEHELSSPLTWVGLTLEELESRPLAAQDLDRVRSARSGLHRMRHILAAMRQGARFANGDLREVVLSQELDQALTLVAVTRRWP